MIIFDRLIENSAVSISVSPSVFCWHSGSNITTLKIGARLNFNSIFKKYSKIVFAHAYIKYTPTESLVLWYAAMHKNTYFHAIKKERRVHHAD